MFYNVYYELQLQNFVIHLVIMLNCPLNTYFEVHEWCCSYVHFNKIVLKEQN
jgi:hypothetical protein